MLKKQPRHYQAAAIPQLRAALRGKKSALYVLPTGGGKTFVFCLIAELATMRGKRVVILVHRRELVRQCSESLRDVGMEHGIIAAGFPADHTKRVQIASVGTLANRVDAIVAPDLVIVDEAHHITAGQWRAIADHWSASGAKTLGVTATPERLDGTGLGDFFESIVEGPGVRDLIEAGFLARYKLFEPDLGIDFNAFDVARGDYIRSQIEKALDRKAIYGDVVQHYRKICHGVPAIAFCATVKHAEAVAAEFRRFGYRAQSVDGSMTRDARDSAIAGLASGSVQILCSCDLISEGVDVPAASCAILLRPTASLALYLQQIGRVLRPAPGKRFAYIVDHVGNRLRHGLPDAKRSWTLAGRKKKRKAPAPPRYSLGYVRCIGCQLIIGIRFDKCPECGTHRTAKPTTIRNAAGELVEVDIKAAEEHAKNALLWEQRRAQTLADLQRIGRRAGRKPAWAFFVWSNRQKKRNR